MPLYEYRCKACGTKSEFLVRPGPGSDPLVCPACGGEELVKALSVPAAPVMRSAARTPCGDAPCCGREQQCGQAHCME